MTESQQLLAEYAETGSETAFRELVARYIGLVYSTALRLVGSDAATAEDVTQTVFLPLSRNARKLARGSLLGGWLHRDTCYVAAKTLRRERRRQAREREAVLMNSLEDHSQANLDQVAPLLDDAINQLGTEDRAAVLLRFFEQRDFRAVGAALGSTEDAARMRVTRALEKLQVLLRHRGVTLSAAGLGAILAGEAVTAAPAGLAATVAGGVLAGSLASGGVVATLLRIMTMTKLKAGIIGALIIAGVATSLLLQQQARARLRAQDELLQRRSEQLPQVAADNRRLSYAVAPERSSRQKLSNSESVRLPAEAESLLRQTSSSAVLRAAPLRAADGMVRLSSARSPDTKIRIEGTSTIHDWQVESPIIIGTMDVGAGFPMEPGQAATPGKLEAQADVAIPVTSLKSVKKDGTPYEDKMDAIMYGKLKQSQFQRIYYHLDELVLKEAAKVTDAPYVCEATGDLAVAGVTNKITMPVNILPLGENQVKVSGSTALKMSDFKIEAPVLIGILTTGDDIKLKFAWLVVQKPAAGVASGPAHLAVPGKSW